MAEYGPVAKLVCVECGTSSEDGSGWRAEPVTDDEELDPDELAIYCPNCWEREFG
jgi:hypothetical protein